MIAGALALALLTQLAQLAARDTLPVLAFPEPGLDDPAAYQGYQTRFYRDAKGNAVQIYLDARSGRVVEVWADAANESIGFTARDGAGRPARLSWGGVGAEASDSGAMRTLQYHLAASAPQLQLGWFLLGSMRVERDFQYARRHLQPFTAPPFRVAEESTLVASVERLPPNERARHMALLGARSAAELRARLEPAITVARSDTLWHVRIEQTSLGGEHHLVLELLGDPRRVELRAASRGIVALRARPREHVRFTVRTSTDAAPLTPLARDEIFNRDFLAFLAAARASRDSVRYRRLEREVRGVELLSSAEKLMAGMPNYATYFGRDMMMTALMMRPIWTATMSEHVIASVLRKLSPTGHVSHEEALAGQAIRESAAEYSALITDYLRLARGGQRPRADSVLERAGAVLRDRYTVRENYHMMDGEFQLPVLIARYLGDPTVSAGRKRAFLLERSGDSPTRLALLLRELSYVATLTAPYVDSPTAQHLVAFPRLDSTHWRSASWRDSNAGYANGRYAMDINAIWAPEALRGITEILAALRAMNVPDLEGTAGVLATYVRDPAALRRAVDVWSGARRHFTVTFSPAQIREHVSAKLAWLPARERRYWQRVMTTTDAARDSMEFLALSLEASGRPIPVVNTDPATGLFLSSARPPGDGSRDVGPFVRAYPVGLFIDQVGPVVANDAYASSAVWDAFRADTYHSPRVVWGREVNLLLLGLGGRIAAAYDSAGRLREPALAPSVRALDAALRRTLAAVQASGFEHSELWSYQIEGGRLRPVRYGISSDLQLWSSADLAVQYMLAHLPHQ